MNDCHHCFVRFMNHTWGEDLRPLDIEKFKRKLYNGMRNNKPKTSLASALASKKTIRWGSKSDPFQAAELQHRVSREVLKTLIEYDWSFVIVTMCTDVMMEYEDLLIEAAKKNLVTVQVFITPGLERDWEVFERKRTTPIPDRFNHIYRLKSRGIPVAANGEPFIPGFHDLKDFRRAARRLKEAGVDRWNTYNLHLNPHVAKRFAKIGLDLEKIWEMNQDSEWKKILPSLLQMAEAYDIKLGSPDFVNSGARHRDPANTCCGIDVPNPTTFNTHTWKRRVQEENSPEGILEHSWDGIGDFKKGVEVFEGTAEDLYTMKDAGFGFDGRGDYKLLR